MTHKDLETYRTSSVRFRAFLAEWSMRNALLKLDHRDEQEIAAHRKEILHVYQLTEEEIQQYLKEHPDDFTGI